jgi:hypothetical protein
MSRDNEINGMWSNEGTKGENKECYTEDKSEHRDQGEHNDH